MAGPFLDGEVEDLAELGDRRLRPSPGEGVGEGLWVVGGVEGVEQGGGDVGVLSRVLELPMPPGTGLDDDGHPQLAKEQGFQLVQLLQLTVNDRDGGNARGTQAG